MFIRLITFAITVFSFFPNNKKIISGKIYSSKSGQFYNIKNVDIIFLCNNKPFDTINTNDKGEFLAAIPNTKEKNIDISYVGIGFRKVYLKHIKQLVTDTTNLLIDLTYTYKKNIFGKAICPKCNKSDEIFPVQYGDAPIYTVEVNDDGDTTYNPIRNGVYQSGTCVSSFQSAQWYCKRDNIEF